MSAIRVLLQSARLSVFQPTGSSAIDVKGWIANRNYFVDTNLLAGEFSLRASDSNELRRALANDLNRMTAAAFESAAGIASDPVLPRSLAWGSIRSYYSSFFAAHALMRLFGTACSQLDPEHVDAIYTSAQVFGRTGGLNSLSSGFYSVEIDSSFSLVKFRKLKESHKDTWSVFLLTLNAIEGNIPGAAALSAHKIAASALISDLKDGLTRDNSNKGNWLSSTRNSINYRLTHEVWFPHRSRAVRAEVLQVAARKWLQVPSPISSVSGLSDLDVYFDVSVMTVALLRELFSTGAALSNPIDEIFTNGSLRLLNDIMANRNTPKRSSQ